MGEERLGEKKGIEDLWSEKDLIERLNLKFREKSGKSSTVGRWVAMGLPYFKYSDKRWFLGSDILGFMMKKLRKKGDL